MPSTADGLTEAQHEAVTHPAGPLLVVGAAGTGKTHVLIERFVWLAERDGSPEHLLALSPRPGAAAAIRASLETRVRAPCEELWGVAIEDFCARLLHDEALEAGHDPFFATVSAGDRVALLLERIDELTLRRHEIRGNPAPLIASFVARIDRLKEQMISPAQYGA